jgi:acyl-CoA oxidase
MRKMTALWGLHVLRTYGDQGYVEEYLTPKHMKDIEKEYLDVSRK